MNEFMDTELAKKKHAMKSILTIIIYPLVVGLILFFIGRLFPPADRIIYLEFRQGGDRIIANAPDSFAGKIEIFIDGIAFPNASERKNVLINETGINLNDVGVEFELPETFKGKLLSSSFLPPDGVADSAVERISETEFQMKTFNSSTSGSYSELYEFSFVTDEPIGGDIQIRINGSGIKLREYDFQKNKWIGNLIFILAVASSIVFYSWFLWGSYILGKETTKRKYEFISEHLQTTLSLSTDLNQVSKTLEDAFIEWRRKPENSFTQSVIKIFKIK